MIWPRVLIGVMFVALPIWAGGFGRSLWTIPPLILVFTLAYIDGKNTIWRRDFLERDWRFKLRQIVGALIAETVLVGALFFIAAGVAAAFDALPPRAPFDRLDATLLALALALSLGGMAVLRAVEGGRDPVVRALERFGEELTQESGGEAEDDPAERYDELDPQTRALCEVADALAADTLDPEANEIAIADLARRLAALDPPERAREPAFRMIDLSEEIEGPNAAAARRAGYRGLMMLTQRPDGAEMVSTMGAAAEIVFTLKDDPSDAVRLEALALAEAMIALDFPAAAAGGALMETIEAVARGDTGQETALENDPALRERLGALAEALLRRRDAV